MINHYAGNLKYGMEYRHFFLARHLRRAGHQPCIISSSFHHLFTKPPDVSGEVSFEIFEDVPFGFIRVPRYNGNGLGRLVNIMAFSWKLNREYRVFEKWFGRPDVLLGSTPHPFVYFNLIRLKKAYEIPVLFEVRDLWPQMLIELGAISRFHPISLLFYWIERRAYEDSDRVISLWHSADRYMLEHGLKRERYVYLPNGIELPPRGQSMQMDFSHPLIRLVQDRLRAGKFLVGYGGSHGLANPLKCVVDACAIFKKRGVREVEFFLVGNGPTKREIVEYAGRLGLDNIHFHDYVDKPVIMAFYRLLDVAYVGLRDLPLFKYGPTSNKLMDYLAVGKPIIHAINSSFNPIKQIGAGVSIPPDDPERLVDAILKLKRKTPEERASMGARGRRYAERELNFRTLADKLAALCFECISQKNDHNR
jgi:glycosyltransferase involved in cell wall biosynthesis